jgi:hypothetical protein
MKKTINIVRNTAFAVALGACATFGNRASANTITIAEDAVLSPSGGNTKFSYSASLDNGKVTAAGGNGRIILYDFAGYVAGSIFAPVGWSVDATQFATPVTVGLVDNPLLVNLVFVRTGADIVDAFGGATTLLGAFGAVSIFSSSILPLTENYATRDQTTSGGARSSSAGTVATPDPLANTPVPDGGLTVTLLGFALIGLGSLRWKLRQ